MHQLSTFDNRTTPVQVQDEEQLINIQNTSLRNDSLERSRSHSKADVKTTDQDHFTSAPFRPYQTWEQDQPDSHSQTPSQSMLSNHNAGYKEQLTKKSKRRSANSKSTTRECNLGWKGELEQSQAVSSVHDCNQGVKWNQSQGLSSVHDCN